MKAPFWSSSVPATASSRSTGRNGSMPSPSRCTWRCATRSPQAEADDELPRAAPHRRRPRLLRRPGPQRPALAGRRHAGARRRAGGLLQSAGPQAARAALPGGRRRQWRRCRRRLQHRARLRHRARGTLRELHPVVCARSASSRIPAAPGCCRAWSGRPARGRWRCIAEPLPAEKAEAWGLIWKVVRRRRH